MCNGLFFVQWIFFVHDGFMKQWFRSVSGHRVCSVVKYILQLYGSGAAAINKIFMSVFDMWIDVIGCTFFSTISHMMRRYSIVHFMYPAYKHHMQFE